MESSDYLIISSLNLVEEKLFCSGHGVTVVNGKCLCDLGYAGPTCSEAVSNGKKVEKSGYNLIYILNPTLQLHSRIGRPNPQFRLDCY